MPAEQRGLRGKIRSLTARGRRTSRLALPLTAGVILVLWIWTLLASSAPWLIVTAFWLVVGSGIALWVRRDMTRHGRQFEEMASGFESALRRNAADMYDVRARSFAEFEEAEDEGACFAFELDGNRLVFVSGQEFYGGGKFPSLDFSLAYILNERDQPVDMLIDKRGPRVAAARTISAATKATLDVPGHLEVRAGTLDDLEAMLQPRGPRT